jgi:hypothetical protein
MLGGKRTDRFHLGANVDWLEPRDALLDLGNALAEPQADDVERIEGVHQ